MRTIIIFFVEKNNYVTLGITILMAIKRCPFTSFGHHYWDPDVGQLFVKNYGYSRRNIFEIFKNTTFFSKLEIMKRNNYWH